MGAGHLFREASLSRACFARGCTRSSQNLLLVSCFHCWLAGCIWVYVSMCHKVLFLKYSKGHNVLLP